LFCWPFATNKSTNPSSLFTIEPLVTFTNVIGDTADGELGEAGLTCDIWRNRQEQTGQRKEQEMFGFGAIQTVAGVFIC
jgi:hypothetical protein